MSFRNYKDKIDEGDTVILYLSNNVHAIDVKPEIKNKKGEMVENVFQTTFGALKVKNLIGVEYGSKAKHRDVLEEGFGDDLDGKADAVFLDLPSPWAGVPHAAVAIKEDGE
ncbi:hypothetical protein MSG28_011923 [Choristoneura fumiferana]|uniref:Uncharacterized protein n=1 Tax=Choristoneura fumiferana TaxID=7141 RepID=A0ACC0KMV0_CHOFU|nr:hypothetical protein MSG28_011923 [Choristoneura fumiferana]